MISDYALLLLVVFLLDKATGALSEKVKKCSN